MKPVFIKNPYREKQRYFNKRIGTEGFNPKEHRGGGVGDVDTLPGIAQPHPILDGNGRRSGPRQAMPLYTQDTGIRPITSGSVRTQKNSESEMCS